MQILYEVVVDIQNGVIFNIAVKSDVCFFYFW